MIHFMKWSSGLAQAQSAGWAGMALADFVGRGLKPQGLVLTSVRRV